MCVHVYGHTHTKSQHKQRERYTHHATMLAAPLVGLSALVFVLRERLRWRVGRIEGNVEEQRSRPCTHNTHRATNGAKRTQNACRTRTQHSTKKTHQTRIRTRESLIMAEKKARERERTIRREKHEMGGAGERGLGWLDKQKRLAQRNPQVFFFGRWFCIFNRSAKACLLDSFFPLFSSSFFFFFLL